MGRGARYRPSHTRPARRGAGECQPSEAAFFHSHSCGEQREAPGPTADTQPESPTPQPCFSTSRCFQLAALEWVAVSSPAARHGHLPQLGEAAPAADSAGTFSSCLTHREYRSKLSRPFGRNATNFNTKIKQAHSLVQLIKVNSFHNFRCTHQDLLQTKQLPANQPVPSQEPILLHQQECLFNPTS